MQFKKVIIPTYLWEKMLDVGRETTDEVAFHLLGRKRADLSILVLDVIEVDYRVQSGGFVRAGLRKEARIKAGIPVGLDYVGLMHKHPGWNRRQGYEPRYSKLNHFSGTDNETFTRKWREGSDYVYPIYYSDGTIASFSVNDNGSVELIETEIIDDQVDKLVYKKMSFKLDVEVACHPNMSLRSFKFAALDRIGSEIEKLYKRGDLVDELNAELNPTVKINEVPNYKLGIRPLKMVKVQLGENPAIQYRFYMKETETLEDLRQILLKEFGIYAKLINGGEELPLDMKIGEVNSVIKLIRMRPPGYFEDTMEKIQKEILVLQCQSYFLNRFLKKVEGETEWNYERLENYKDKLKNKRIEMEEQ